MAYRILIDSALAYASDTHRFEDIVKGVEQERFLFWPGKESCLITELVQLPRKRVFHVFLAAGNLEEIKSMDSSLVTYAKALKCHAITLSGRRGWKKALADLDYQFSHIEMYKEIKHG